MNPTSLINWMMLSTLLLSAWWLCYRLVLHQERSFAYNRGFLVLGPVLAAGLPLLPLSWPTGWGTVPAVLPGMATVMLPAVEVGASAATAGPDWAFWLWAVYVTGALLVLVRLGLRLGKLWLTTRTLPGEQCPGYTLVRTAGQLPTSSFGRVVFWDETLPLSASEANQVLRHELAHVDQGHTYDRLLLELLRAVLWFNPFVHLCSRALGLTHEYMADAAALGGAGAVSAGTSLPNAYTHLLARQVVGRLGFSVPLAHSFSYSQTLRRIAMIQKTSPIRRWKQWLALPLAASLLLAVACERKTETVTPAGTPISTVTLGADATPPPPPKLVTPDPKDMPAPPAPPAVYTYVEQMPELPGGGGAAAIINYIQQHVAYPNVAPAARVNGRVFASFIVAEKGDVEGVHILKGLGPEYDAAVRAAIRQLPRFTPGMKLMTGAGEEKAVAVSYTVPVQFAWSGTSKAQ